MHKIILFIVLLLFSCHQPDEEVKLKAFSSDGCSLFPDRSVITEQDWCECCFQHDIAYWQGGTEQQRVDADIALKQCVLQKTGNESLAKVMYEGVRLGGSPYFYSWYRWGYGWPYLDSSREKYQALSGSQLEQVKTLTEQYLASNKNNYCDSR